MVPTNYQKCISFTAQPLIVRTVNLGTSCGRLTVPIHFVSLENPGLVQSISRLTMNMSTLSQIFILWSVIIVRINVNQASPIYIKAAILLTSGTTLPYDYYNLAPVIDLAVQRALSDYNVIIELQLALYQGQCNVSQAVGQAVQAIIANVDLVIGPACTPDMIAVSQITTYYKLSLLTGAGNFSPKHYDLIQSRFNYDLIDLIQFSFQIFGNSCCSFCSIYSLNW